MKKYVGLIVVLLMLLSLFTGCADKADVTEETGETETQAAEAEQTDAVNSDTDTSGEQNEKINYSETATLNMDWVAHAGAETYIANPWAGVQGLYSELLYDTIVSLDPDNFSMVPCLAKDYSISDDGLTYRFVFEEGVKWHDGESFTADDVAFSLNSIARMPDSPYQLNSIEGAQDVKDGLADSMSGVIVESISTT